MKIFKRRLNSTNHHLINLLSNINFLLIIPIVLRNPDKGLLEIRNVNKIKDKSLSSENTFLSLSIFGNVSFSEILVNKIPIIDISLI